MECNKDEAVRARDLAEKKMLSKDFTGAKRFAVKAQQLFPDIDGISQMMTVCEVHVASEVKINGVDDWYGVLQVPFAADETLVKKQYRKFAFLLHPDKNKYPGAEEAFKLVGEAHRILTDSSKRSFYDMKRSISSGVVKQKLPPKPANANNFSNGEHGAHVRKKFSTVNFSGPNHEQQPPTFWTTCPFCRIRYQYYRAIMNRSLRCQNCMKPFVAYDLDSQSVPAAPTSGYAHHNDFSCQNTSNNMPKNNQSNAARGSTPKQHGIKNDLGGKCGKSKKDGSGLGTGGKTDDIKYEKVNLEETNRRDGRSAKRNRRVATSTGSGRQNDDFSSGKKGNDNDAVGSLKRQRNDKSAAEQIDDDLANKFAKGAGMAERKDNLHNGNDDGGNFKGSDACSKDETDATCVYDYPDPEFYEFEQIRSADLFEVGQVWAIYDDTDGMPRFYGRIKSVFVTPSFKVRFSWFENDANSQHEIDWADRELPFGSGNFKLGTSQTSKDLPMFSHLMQCERGSKKHSYVIRPRKGEIWAIFKAWDMKWAYEPEVRKSYEYEYVEILSGDAEPVVSVMPLIKVEGFVSVFTRPVNAPIPLNVQPEERLRFSHMVPSHILTGSEREGIPIGSFELDPASLTASSEKLHPSVSCTPPSKPEAEAYNKESKMNTSSLNLDPGVKHGAHERNSEDKRDLHDSHESGSLERRQNPVGNAGSMCDEVDPKKGTSQQKTHDTSSSCQSSCPDELLSSFSPESEFHDFSLDKSLDKVQVGQIWALYSDIDGLPKYYCVINNVDARDSKVHLTWLEGRPLMEDEVKWTDNELPLSCGHFKISSDSEIYDSLGTFSHLVPTKAPRPSDKKQIYQIYPRAGEVWALYRNFSTDWDRSNLASCEHDVVEVGNVSITSIEVSFLVKVEGYTSVFEPKQANGVIARESIHRSRFVHFSHCIPAFRLTDQRGGKLRGFWELDPAALPEHILGS